ncbi:glycine betaine ABC transporter substrate-binding protein [Salibacterium halotolerans]|uniref:Glycine betaine/proline transport system substrate-binding protein n=1 Tax=Salibacterium halotolerans TaxID=1884432 RepID=A0A1I5LJW3_9BACI|nr:glycine betaine ABC transporter substrate-binding protein [Salibacterium halotolerans]SFO97618.1 glycine betaine/proline transport system substrate-binding protein [Salibacterium halotolerans]
MLKLKWKRLGLAVGLSLTLAAAGCGSEEGSGSSDGSNGGESGGSGEETDSGSGSESSEGSSEGESSGSTNYGEKMDYQITGIEAGAGVVGAAETAVETYDSLAGWEVATSSSGAMTTALGEAIDNEEPIIVTGWSPHWKFQQYDLKYLEDPENVFGDAENIKTMVRQGLEEDMPNAYTVLDQFQWDEESMNSVMLNIQDGASPEEAAASFVEENQDMVSSWKEGAEQVDGKEIELVYVEWETEVASTHVVGEVLSNMGFEVTTTPLDNAVMWQSIAGGEADGMVAAWLPLTHGDLYEEHKDNLVDLGNNLEGVRTGLVVPEYMDVNSIEDLTPAE